MVKSFYKITLSFLSHCSCFPFVGHTTLSFANIIYSLYMASIEVVLCRSVTVEYCTFIYIEYNTIFFFFLSTLHGSPNQKLPPQCEGTMHAMCVVSVLYTVRWVCVYMYVHVVFANTSIGFIQPVQCKASVGRAMMLLWSSSWIVMLCWSSHLDRREEAITTDGVRTLCASSPLI